MGNLLAALSAGVKWRAEALSESFQLGKDKFRKDMFVRMWGGLPSVAIDDIAPPLKEPLEIIHDHICLPPYYVTSSHDDFSPLMRIVKHYRPKVIFEVGTAHGNTVANLCQNSDAKIVTVNALPEQMSGHLTTFTLNKSEIGCVYKSHGFENRVTQIFENTLNLDVKKYFATPSVDLAIIDGCHDKYFVINDFKRILPALTPEAIVLFHDTHPSMADHLAGSYKACVKLRHAGFDVNHLKDTWWALWKKPKTVAAS